MSATTQYLDQCKIRLKLESDYALAKHFDITPQQMSNYRNERNGADTILAAQIAQILKKDPMEVIRNIQKETARTEKARNFWKNYGTAAALLLTVATTTSVYLWNSINSLYIM